MSGHTSQLPLTRRLVTWYLAFGLAGLFLSLAITMWLVYQGKVQDLAHLAAFIPLGVIAVGAVVLYQAVQFHARIEDQLLKISADPSNDRIRSATLDGDDPAVAGWNKLLDRIASNESLVLLERRLAGSLNNRRDHRPTLALQALSEGVALTETDGVILYANRSLALLSGLAQAEDVVGKNLISLLRINEAHNAAQARTSLLTTGINVVFELQRTNQLRDGVLRVSRHVITDPECGLPRVVWTVRDVTQQAIVDDARNQFVSLATHELRTPLANIKAYAETLAIHEGIDVEKQKEFCNIINEEATRLSRFVDEMLNVSQIEAGSMSIDRRETDIARLLQDVVEHVRPQFEKKQIAFEIKQPPKFPSLKLDKDKFEAALVNLLGNAAKYTPDGGRVAFEVQLRGQTIEFSVSDTGIGIAPEEAARVFEKFFRSNDSRVRNIEGNGLGLTFTQEVIRLHGGKLTLESELNKGSRFTAVLPLPEAGDA